MWLTSDPHYFQKQVIHYEKARSHFKTLDEMHDELIRKFNECVRPNDDVTILGDFSFGGVKVTRPIIERLNGRKRLILGNHDWKHSPEKWIREGFHSAAYYDEIVVDGIRITMKHFPLKPKWWQWVGYDRRYMDKRTKDEGQWHLHGHVHSKYRFRDKQINVGVDVWNLRPVHLSEIMVNIKGHSDSLI